MRSTVERTWVYVCIYIPLFLKVLRCKKKMCGNPIFTVSVVFLVHFFSLCVFLSFLSLPPLSLAYSNCWRKDICHAQTSSPWNIYHQKVELRIAQNSFYQTKVKAPVNVKNHRGMRCICAQARRGGGLQLNIPHWAVKYPYRLWRDCRSQCSFVLFALFCLSAFRSEQREFVSSVFGIIVKVKRKGWRIVGSLGRCAPSIN